MALTAAAVAAIAGVTLPHQPRKGASEVLPLDHPRLRSSGDGRPEQVHVDMGWRPDSVFVAWVTQADAVSTVAYGESADPTTWGRATGTAEVYSTILAPDWYTNPTIPTPCQGKENYTNPECYYTSGLIHTVFLQGLKAGTRYFYQPLGAVKVYNFTTVPFVSSTTALSIGVIGDLGQTVNSSETVDKTLQLVADGSLDAVILAGDLSYADGYAPRWDSYARAFEPLWSSVVTSHTGGNHEVSSGYEKWQAYKARYPNPWRESGSYSHQWYSTELGPLHVVSVCSYADARPGSFQYEWIKRDLQSVDRSRTPWVVVMFHVPWWTSNAHHPRSEGDALRESLEGLFVDNEVDLIVSGHVHAYERSLPVAGNGTDCKKGITHITIGDGGNREHFATPWVEPQPEWSAIREYAYGMGQITFFNESAAVWRWHRNPDPWNPNPGHEVGDEYWMYHPRRGC